MRSTVGPLPPTVYWRRRAVVLVAVLLAVILLFVACGGNGDDSDKRGTGAASQGPSAPTSAPATPDDVESFAEGAPGPGPSLPAREDLQPGAGTGTPGAGGNPSAAASAGGDTSGTTTGNNSNITAPADGSCADQEISLTPVPAAPTAKQGTAVEIRLKIKNISTRACTRDLGAGAQELYIDQGARKFWSSDTCNADRSANPQIMQPGAESEFTVTWNGRQSSKCQAQLAAGPVPVAGTYEVRARLGTKRSDPVNLALTA